MTLRQDGTGTGRTSGEDIAIVGMSCIFPGAENIEQYWHNIVHKVDCVTEPPPDWQPELFLDPSGTRSDRVYTGKGGYLGDLSRFSPAKYGVMPNSVEGAEPDQFLALRCAFDALADAGVPEIPIHGEKTGVILGRGTFVNRGFVTLLEHGFVVDQVVNVIRQLEPDRPEAELNRIGAALKANLPPSTAETAPGLAHSVLAGRIANRMDLNGPAYTLDAACASSLLAVEHAVHALRSGQCDAVLAGGVQVSTPGLIHILFCQLEALSKAGRIAPFSAEAGGTLLGEGCGMLLLKRRSDAERDGNRIYALIKAVGMASDGKGGGLLAPRQEGQVLSIRRAYEQAGVDPATVELIEAHGTGIPLGDQTELGSLTAVFGPRVGDRPTVALGSVKSMISHLIPAAGSASLIKVALSLYHRVLPPTLHAERPNPNLGLDTSRFYLNTETRPWIHDVRTGPRRAGTNAFGFGGINGHAILEEPPETDAADEEVMDRTWPIELVVVSARDRETLAGRVETLAAWIEKAEGISLLDVAASCGAKPGPVRVAVCAKDLADLVKKLKHVGTALGDRRREKIQDRSGIFFYDQPLAKQGRIAFVFPGEGAQYVNMLADLCRHFPEVRREFDLTDRALSFRGADRRPSRAVFPLPGEVDEAERELFEMEGAVESVATADRALLRLLERLDVRCDAIVGHSSGEFTALVAAGVIDISDDESMVVCIADGFRTTQRIVEARRFEKASLATVGGVERAVVDEAVAAVGDGLVVAMDNCPHQLVLVGHAESTTKVLEKLKTQGALCQPLPWDRPYHTEAYKPVAEFLREYYGSLSFGAGKVETWSCATADRYPGDPDAIRELAIRQWYSPVRFRETIEKMYEAGVRVFVESGPRGNLSAFITDTLSGRPHAAVPMNLPRKSGLEQLCRAMGMLAAHGVPLDLTPLYGRRRGRRLDFGAEPPVATEPDPILRLDLPELKLDEQTVGELRVSSNEKPRAVEAAAVPRPPVPGESGAVRQAGPDDPARARAYTDYQRTMRLFLETQKNVMASVLGRKEGGDVRAAPRPAVPVSDDPPAAWQKSQEDDSAAGSTEKETGERPAVVSGQSLAGQLAEIISDRTGYPPEMLDLDANLEADLGIDSIKRVEIIGAFRRAVLPQMQEPPAEYMEKMTSAVSLRAILDVMNDWTGSDGPDAAGAQKKTEPVAESATGNPETSEAAFPFLETILTFEPQVRLVAECELDVHRHRFLLDHTFGQRVSVRDPDLKALPLMPLAMTMELMAEAAARLLPDRVVGAICDLKTLRWLSFETPTRRVRIEAAAETEQAVYVSVYEADREGMHAAVAEGRVEMAPVAASLGSPTIQPEAPEPSRWAPRKLYAGGLFHGPAFQAVHSMDGVGPTGARATLVELDWTLLFASGEGGPLILPVSLIDGAGQVLGFWGAQRDLVMGFPTGLERLEVDSGAAVSDPLSAQAVIRQPEASLWDSDVEVSRPDGRVVLRITGRRDRVIDVPGEYWRYRVDPEHVVFSRDISYLYRSVPGANDLRTCELTDFRRAVLLETAGFWALVLSHLVLSRAEREVFAALKRPPRAVADWLLGRLVAKDAVRLYGGLEMPMADVEIGNGEHGMPIVDAGLAPDRTPLISLSHANLDAVAVAADPARFAGVGVDIEAVRPLPPEVLEDTFSEAERTRIEAVARPTGESTDAWYVSCWSAKEAVGKALGRGVAGGPGNVKIEEIDAETERISVSLAGAMRDVPAACESFTGDGSRLDVHRRIHRGRALALCLLERSEKQSS